MIKIETIEIAGFAAALSALRLPFGKDMRSVIRSDHNVIDRDGESRFDSETRIWIADKDLDLMNTLVKRGTEHAKVTRGIMVWAKITAPIYWWCEMETYVVGHQRLSSESTMHVDCRGLSGDDLKDWLSFWRANLRRAKRYWSMNTETLDKIQDGEIEDKENEED